MSYILTEEKLLKANKRLLKDLHAELGIDKSVLSNNQLLQKICNAMFSKPFEEVKATLFNEDCSLNIIPKERNVFGIDETKEVAKVFIINYEDTTIITFHDEIYKSFDSNIDTEISKEEINCMAIELAKIHRSYVREISLPEILDGFDAIAEDNIIALAHEMEYFSYPQTIFDLIDDSETRTFIDGEYTPYGLDGEWESEIVSEYDGESDIGDFVIWHPEIGTNKDHSHREYYFTYNDLCKAVKKSDNTWIIKENDHEEYILTFAKNV